MPVINWDIIEDVNEFSPIPAGDYPFKVVDVKVKSTKAGDPMWNLELELIDNQYSGRKVWDNITFNLDGLKRVKLVCSRLGLKTEGKIDLKPEMLIGQKGVVTLVKTSYIDPEGHEKPKNEIPFAGYKSLDGELINSNDVNISEEKLPF